MRTYFYIIVFAMLVASTVYSQSQWDWAKNAGGKAYDKSSYVTTDLYGNVFVVGVFYSPVITVGTIALSNYGNDNIFVAKYDASGNVLWAKSAEGTGGDWVTSVSTDAGGNVFITGGFTSPLLNFGNITLSTPGFFLAKYDANGNIVWAKETATGGGCGNSLNADVQGDVIVTGNFGTHTITFGSITLTNASTSSQCMTPDLFVVKYDKYGNELWAQSSGGTDWEYGGSVCTDPGGNIIVTGAFASSNIVFGSINLIRGGCSSCINYDVFVVKLDPNGNAIWAKNAWGVGAGLDGICGNTGFSVSADPGGNVFVTGWFTNAGITFGSVTLSNSGYNNAFIAKYDPNGNILWARRVGGSEYEEGFSVSADLSGNVFVTGLTTSPTVTFDTITLASPPGTCNGGCVPMFFAGYDANGNVLFAKIFATGGNERNGVSADHYGNVYITGTFSTDSFIVGTDTLLQADTSSGEGNVFVAKYRFSDLATWAHKPDIFGSISVSPNPSHGLFTLSGSPENSEIKIYNSIGKLIYSGQLKENEMQIDLSDRPKGIYFVEMISEKGRGTQKIVIE